MFITRGKEEYLKTQFVKILALNIALESIVCIISALWDLLVFVL